MEIEYDYFLLSEKKINSFSDKIHKAISNCDYGYKQLPEESLPEFFEERRFSGINITMPYKKKVVDFIDYADEIVRQTGVANVIVNRNGKLFAYNSDAGGMIASIRHSGIELENKKVLILGTGGTSSTACFVAKKLNARQIVFVSRTKSENAVTYGEAYNLHNDCEIIINTTPCGMSPEIDISPIDISAFNNLKGVVDVIYNPLRTKLVCDCEKRKIKTASGLYMLVSQAVMTEQYFTGNIYDSSLTNSLYEYLLNQMQNIVLIGMPSAGKTTVGRIIASKTGLKFIDTDELIEKKFGCSVKEIFDITGEDEFRKAESAIISELSHQNGCVIATGGGCVLNEENIENLKYNGKIYFLDRKAENLVPTDSRPLFSSQSNINKLYCERYGLYKSSCDYVIYNNGSAEEAADKIIKTGANSL